MIEETYWPFCKPANFLGINVKIDIRKSVNDTTGITIEGFPNQNWPRRFCYLDWKELFWYIYVWSGYS